VSHPIRTAAGWPQDVEQVIANADDHIERLKHCALMAVNGELIWLQSQGIGISTEIINGLRAAALERALADALGLRNR
jgi:hypothetical protein